MAERSLYGDGHTAERLGTTLSKLGHVVANSSGAGAAHSVILGNVIQQLCHEVSTAGGD